MSDLLLSIGLILVLLFVGFLFSAAEMALVTLRDSQIQQLKAKGKRGQAIQTLTANPNRFLSSVQIGVTLTGFLSSAFGSDSLARAYLGPWLQGRGMASGLAGVLAVVVVTAAISLASIVFSELTAKRLAMQRPEEFALSLAPMVNVIATIATPLIWLIGACTNLLVRILGGDPNAGKEAVSEDELRSMMANAGMLGDEERQIVDDLFDVGDRSLREVMIPRTEVDFMSGDLPVEQAIELVKGNQRSRYPVTDGSSDQIVGFLHVRDLIGLDEDAKQNPVRDYARPVLDLPETVKVLPALTAMRRASSHLAIVRDEYGGTAGIVTMEDIIEELIGDITDEYDVLDADQIKHQMVSDFEGLISVEDFADRTGYLIPEGPYDTLAGYIMCCLQHVPQLNDQIVANLVPENASEQDQVPERFTMRVSEMDGHRIAWVDVTEADEDTSIMTKEDPHPASL